MKPKPISESEVRITDISVRSALMRVRWNDIPVWRAASSWEISDGSGVVRGRGLLAMSNLTRASRNRYGVWRTMQRNPRWHVEVSTA